MRGDVPRRDPCNPFKGLESFDPTDTLFGRDQDFTLMRERVYAAKTTLLFAASGVGKTSFLKARFLPEVDGEFIVCSQRDWAAVEPADAVIKAIGARLERQVEPQLSLHSVIESSFRRPKPPGPDEPLPLRPVETARRDLLLVLDQFEEVFQYWGFRPEFTAFVEQLAAVINDRDLCVRVVFSMRDDFLGRLSVFDNRIPDLFNNYYRLKSPTKAQAMEIIERTVDTREATVDAAGLEALADDLVLATRPKSGLAEPEPTETTRASRLVTLLSRLWDHIVRAARWILPGGIERPPDTEIVERDFIAPPYLQIVCRELWDRRFAAGATDAFLKGYMRSGEREHNAALTILRQFCRDRLGHLASARERDLAARAFQFLMTREGAKMAYQRRRLAEHMRTDADELTPVLKTLSDDRILRRFKGPDDSWWYELSHDMYAPILSDWKYEYQRTRDTYWRVRNIALLLLLAAAFVWSADVKRHKSLIDDATEDYPVRAYDALRARFPFGLAGIADRPWARYWDRRAERAELLEDRDRALLFRLIALETRRTPDRERAAARLIAGDYATSLHRTLRAPGPIASMAFSPDEKYLVAVTGAGAGRIWELESAQQVGSFDADWLVSELPERAEVHDVKFTASDRIITSIGEDLVAVWKPTADKDEWTAAECHKGVTAFTTDATGTRLVVADANGGVGTGSSAIDCAEPPSPDEEQTAQVRRVLPPAVRPRARVYEIRASADGSILAASSDGSVFTHPAKTGTRRRVLKITVPPETDEAIRFSPDGRFIGTVSAAAGGTFQLYDAAGKPMGPATRVDAASLLDSMFSGDGRYVILSMSGDVRWHAFDGRTGEPVSDVPPPEVEDGVLAPDARIAATADEASVWLSRTGQAVVAPVIRETAISTPTFSGRGTYLATAAAGGTIRVWTRLPQETLPPGFLQKKDGVTDVGIDGARSCSYHVDAKGHIVAEGVDGRVARIAAVAAPRRLLGADGCRVFATVDAGGGLRVWREGRSGGVTLAQDAQLERSALTRTIFPLVFSPDGTRLAGWRSRGGVPEGVFLWDTATGRRIAHIADVRSAARLATARSAAFSPDSSTLVVTNLSASGTPAQRVAAVRLVSARDGRIQGSAQVPAGTGAYTIAVSNDAVAVSTAGGTHLVRMNDQNVVRLSQVPQGARGVAFMRFDGAGRRLAVVEQGTLSIYDVASGAGEHVVSGESFVRAAFNGQHAHLVLAVSRRGVQLLDVRSGKSPAPSGPFVLFSRPAEGLVTSLPVVEFTGDGNGVVVATKAWMHKLAVTDNGLATLQSRMLPAPRAPGLTFRVLDPAGNRAKALIQIGEVAWRLEDVSFSPSAPVAGAVSLNREEWQRKIGLRLENGDLLVRQSGSR